MSMEMNRVSGIQLVCGLLRWNQSSLGVDGLSVYFGNLFQIIEETGVFGARVALAKRPLLALAFREIDNLPKVRHQVNDGPFCLPC